METLSQRSYAALQDAAREVLASLDPETIEIGVGWVAPEAPIQFTPIPIQFVISLSEKEK